MFVSIDFTVKFKDMRNTIKTFFIPRMSQNVILGVNFWIKFQAAPQIMSEIYLNKESSFVENSLALNAEQQSQI